MLKKKVVLLCGFWVILLGVGLNYTPLNVTEIPEPIGYPTIQRCLNNDTLFMEWNYTITQDSYQSNFSQTRNITCEYGCSWDKCNPSPFDTSIWIAVLIVGIALGTLIIMKIKW